MSNQIWLTLGGMSKIPKYTFKVLSITWYMFPQILRLSVLVFEYCTCFMIHLDPFECLVLVTGYAFALDRLFSLWLLKCIC